MGLQDAQAAKILLNGEAVIDLTQTTATASEVVQGYEFMSADGKATVGTFDPNQFATKIELAAALDDLDASAIKFDEDLMVTTAFGYINPQAQNKDCIVIPAGTSLQDFFQQALGSEDRELAGTVLPSISLTQTFQQGDWETEVGTYYDIAYTTSFNSGRYPYEPYNTNISATDTIVKWAGVEVNNNVTGYVPDDCTQLYFTAQATYGDSPVIPKSNYGTGLPEKKIVAGSTERFVGTALSSYRNFFYGCLSSTDLSDITSEAARNSCDFRSKLTKGGKYNSAKNFEISADGITNPKYFVVAIPATNTRAGVIKAETMGGMTIDETALWHRDKDIVVSIAGANSKSPTDYYLYYWTAGAIDAKKRQKIYLG